MEKVQEVEVIEASANEIPAGIHNGVLADIMIGYDIEQTFPGQATTLSPEVVFIIAMEIDGDIVTIDKPYTTLKWGSNSNLKKYMKAILPKAKFLAMKKFDAQAVIGTPLMLNFVDTDDKVKLDKAEPFLKHTGLMFDEDNVTITDGDDNPIKARVIDLEEVPEHSLSGAAINQLYGHNKNYKWGESDIAEMNGYRKYKELPAVGEVAKVTEVEGDDPLPF